MRILNGIGSIPVECGNEMPSFPTMQSIISQISARGGNTTIYYGNGYELEYNGVCPDWLCVGVKIEVRCEGSAVFITKMNDAANR